MSDQFDEKLRAALSPLATRKPTIDLVAAAERRAVVTPPSRINAWALLAIPVLGIAVVVILVSRQRVEVTRAPLNTDVVALSVAGSVWVDDGAARRALRAGDRFTRGELVETADGASVVLLDHGANLVDVRAATRMHCDSSIDETRVDVERGVLRVAVVNRVSLVLHIAGISERVRIDDGVVGIAVSDARGSVAVLEGTASVERDRGASSVGTGRQWLFGGAHDVASPAELTLSIDRLASHARAGEDVVVSGLTQPGALVTVNGVVAAVDVTGAFHVTITLPRQTPIVAVRARDAFDRHKSVNVALREQPRSSPRERRIQTRWHWVPG